MKIIDLLNKVANNDIRLGTKFIWHYGRRDIELILTKRINALGLYIQSENGLIDIFEKYSYGILNEEVERIEEEPRDIEDNEKEKKIPKKIDDIVIKDALETTSDCLLAHKINEIIYYLKSKGDE